MRVEVMWSHVLVTTLTVLTCYLSVESTDSDEGSTESCFCQLDGDIGDCACSIESVDHFNNEQVFPIIDDLMLRNYFRYYKVNMFRPCPFTQPGTGQCGSRSCAVDQCNEEQIPAGLKDEQPHYKYSENANEEDETSTCLNDGQQHELSYLDVKLSKESQEVLNSWTHYDNQQDSFCETEDVESPDAEFYDLVSNPERFTGYAGQSAVNIWKLIYDQNCFKPDKADYGHYLSVEQGMCLEKRVFFRLISGFHTSITVDVTANWLIPGKTAFAAPRWGPNVEEFVKRFDPRYTAGEGPKRLRNMYFTYLVEMRALVKAAPYLLQESYYTGDNDEDDEVLTMIQQLLDVLRSFPRPFDESRLFLGDARRLKEDFKIHFRNISRIIDCVGCDKCRLWGKLQFSGMATALKILFSGDSMKPDSTVTYEHRHAAVPFKLSRSEIVALFNAFARLSKSLHEIEAFRRLVS